MLLGTSGIGLLVKAVGMITLVAPVAGAAARHPTREPVQPGQVAPQQALKSGSQAD